MIRTMAEEADDPMAHLPVLGEVPAALWAAVEGGQPAVLTLGGQPAAVVIDCDSYAEAVALVEQDGSYS